MKCDSKTTLSPGRINCDGRANFPDGEVFTGPLEDATEGVVCFSFPAVHGGREVDGMAVSGVGHTGKRVPHQERFREIIGVWSSLVAREKVHHSINYFES